MVIVDTSVLIDLLAERSTPQTDWLRLNLRSQRIGITTLIMSEVLQGIRSDEQFLAVLDALDQFTIFETGSRAIAVASAHNFRSLRRTGITIRNMVDCFIATFCIEGGHTLLHNDRDFDGFKNHLGLEEHDLSRAKSQ
jgi:predicted nucleic acid-binding protein